MGLTDYIVPLLLAGTAVCALARRVDVYAALTAGAGEGLRVMARICPALIGLLTAVGMFRASGAMDALAGVLAPLLRLLGIPPETAALLLVRPVSGSGALAVGSELMAAYGADSYIGRVAAVMLGCTETTFYTIAVYFGAAGIRRTRYTVPAALTADLTGFIAAALSVRLVVATSTQRAARPPLGKGLCPFPNGKRKSRRRGLRLFRLVHIHRDVVGSVLLKFA